jgi:hypothetical protein
MHVAAHGPAYALPKIEIVSARYDATDGEGGTDVTGKVKAMVASGATEIAANNSNFGDPAYNHVKQLTVQYSVNGKPMEKKANENEIMELVGAGSDSTRPDGQVKNGNLIAWSPGLYVARTSRGRTLRVNAPAAKSIPVAGPWQLSFPPHLGAPATVTLSNLISWTEHPNKGVKYFSGSGTYTTSFVVPKGAMNSSVVPYLDLGRVKNIAEIWLNGRELPELWKAPFRLPATGLHPGRNTLVVRVTNLWPNRVIGDEFLPAENTWSQDGSIAKMPEWALDMKPRPKSPRITFTTWHFFTKDSPLLESGLIGPVSIVMVPSIRLRQ